MNVERLSDETLLAGFGLSDPDAALGFVRRFQTRVFGLAVAVVGDVALAEDVAQRTFERAWKHAQMYDPRRGSVQTWLNAIAHNLAIDSVRVNKPTPVDPEELLLQVAALKESPESRMLSRERSEHVRDALGELPTEQARSLVMASFYGMTAAEVAKAEDIPLGTAKTRIRTAMSKLKLSLDAEEVDA